MIKISAVAMAAALAWPQLHLSAQSEATFVVFHGKNRSTTIVIDDESKSIRNATRKFDRVLPVGSQVCFQIWNAHPVNYKYALETVVDTTSPSLPDLSKIIGFVTGLPGYITNEATRAPIRQMFIDPNESTIANAASSIPPALQPIVNALAFLKHDVDTARAFTAASDAAEAVMEPSAGAKSNYQNAVEKIDALPKDEKRFNDPKLRERHAEALKAAKPFADAAPENRVLVDALGSASELLLTARDKIRSDYSSAVRARPKLCKAVTAGRTTVSLTIQKASQDGTRDVLDKTDAEAPVVEVTSKYSRKIVTIDLVTLGVFANEVPVFAIRNDTLRRDEFRDPTLARPGLMLSLNPFAFGDADNWALGAGVGLGYSAKDIASDLYIGATLSYQNLVRFGVGLGRSSQPRSVKGATLNERIPNDFGKLNDAIENGKLNSKAWYFLLTVPGLSLLSK